MTRAQWSIARNMHACFHVTSSAVPLFYLSNNYSNGDASVWKGSITIFRDFAPFKMFCREAIMWRTRGVWCHLNVDNVKCISGQKFPAVMWNFNSFIKRKIIKLLDDERLTGKVGTDKVSTSCRRDLISSERVFGRLAPSEDCLEKGHERDVLRRKKTNNS